MDKREGAEKEQGKDVWSYEWTKLVREAALTQVRACVGAGAHVRHRREPTALGAPGRSAAGGRVWAGGWVERVGRWRGWRGWVGWELHWGRDRDRGINHHQPSGPLPPQTPTLKPVHPTHKPLPLRPPFRPWLRLHFLNIHECTLSPRQLINVASGFDTRAWRLRWPAAMRMYEIDSATVHAQKAAALGEGRGVAGSEGRGLGGGLLGEGCVRRGRECREGSTRRSRAHLSCVSSCPPARPPACPARRHRHGLLPLGAGGRRVGLGRHAAAAGGGGVRPQPAHTVAGEEDTGGLCARAQ